VLLALGKTPAKIAHWALREAFGCGTFRSKRLKWTKWHAGGQFWQAGKFSLRVQIPELSA
jgi:hypothetical protein